MSEAEERRKENLRKQSDTGARVEHLKAELDEFLDGMDEQVIKTFRVSDPHDHEAHVVCRMYLMVIDDMRTRMSTRIEMGKAATNELAKADLLTFN